MIDLFINGKLVDVQDNAVSMLFQRQRTDYTNPTIIRNSFTKTVKLPGTKNNNRIFGSLWKLDKYINYSSTEFIPSQREPFTLMRDGNLVEKGYVKLNNINYDRNEYTYEITLYGELGNLLYGLSYNIDEDTQEVTPMTLGDLTYSFTEFAISKDLVDMAWKRLDGDPEADGYPIFDTINFIVSYDGVPEADNFDPKQMWCSTDRFCNVWWGTRRFYSSQFPKTFTEDNITYEDIHTLILRTDPDDTYALFDLKNEMTVMETRDLRSYLLRPVVRIKKVFEAIGYYIDSKYGYGLDMSDPFFNTPEFGNLWMTLSMLYEINPAVETGTIFTAKELFGQTSSPASYLVSFCKTYGIYLDVDYLKKKLILTRLPRFFNPTKINDLRIDLSKNVKINPLSFDKATYTFDFSEGEGQFLEKYKETYGNPYGSKRVNTGYRFDASTAPYIDNNVFKQGLDSIDQSPYYKYPYFVRGNHQEYLFDFPGPLMDDSARPTYRLFQLSSIKGGGNFKTLDKEMRTDWIPETGRPGDSDEWESMIPSGYQWVDSEWSGLREGVWQDAFPKLQCHTDDNKIVDGKDILVTFQGFKQISYGTITNTDTKTEWKAESYVTSDIDASKVNFLLSDDWPYLKWVLGKNCWYDNPKPHLSGFTDYLIVKNRIPSFARSTYTYDDYSQEIPGFYTKDFNQYDIYGSSGVTPVKYSGHYATITAFGSGREYSYFVIDTLKRNHRYFIAASIKTNNAGRILSADNLYPYPDIIGSTRIDSRNLMNKTDLQLIASIVDTGDNNLTRVTSLSSYNDNPSSSSLKMWNTYFLVVFDLTEMELDDRITTVDKAIEYFGVTPVSVGHPYFIKDTLDFGIPQEIYVPACIYDRGIGIYNRYWSRYIADVYSVNTRVLDCYCYLDNIDEVFREFYKYDGCLWILSKVTDWNMETKYCKATLIKVNDIDNYTKD